jgi:hypothetical protein
VTEQYRQRDTIGHNQPSPDERSIRLHLQDYSEKSSL